MEEVELIDKKGYLTISLSLVKEGKILLRKPEGIREWYQDLKVRRRKKKESKIRFDCRVFNPTERTTLSLSRTAWPAVARSAAS